MKPRLLDLFCGAGGAAMGYHRAGFDVVGVDIEPQPNYPFEFVQGNALIDGALLALAGGWDLIHASPPCQAYSRVSPNRTTYPDLIAPTRELLQATTLPFVIENVEGAPLSGYLKLCGSIFGMQIQRHRYFEIVGFPVLSPPCNHKAWKAGRPHTITGHADGPGIMKPHSLGFRDTEHAKELMGMPWVQTTREVTEAIPPAYTEWIGSQLLEQLPVLVDPKEIKQ